MPKTHASDTAKIAYRIKPPAVWRAIRAEWEAGAIPVDLARRFDVSASTVQARRDREGWSRDGMLERLGGSEAFAGGGRGVEAGASWTRLVFASPEAAALAVAERALAGALEALALGRATEALALVKTADAVGCFAEYVAHLRIELEAGKGAGE